MNKYLNFNIIIGYRFTVIAKLIEAIRRLVEIATKLRTTYKGGGGKRYSTVFRSLVDFDEEKISPV